MMDTLEMATHGVVPVAKVGAYGEPLTAACCSISVCQAADALETSACADPSRFLKNRATHTGALAPLVGTDLKSRVHSAQAATSAQADIGAPFKAAAALACGASLVQLSGRPVSGSKKWAKCVFTPSRRLSPLVT